MTISVLKLTVRVRILRASEFTLFERTLALLLVIDALPVQALVLLTYSLLPLVVADLLSRVVLYLAVCHDVDAAKCSLWTDLGRAVLQVFE